MGSIDSASLARWWDIDGTLLVLCQRVDSALAVPFHCVVIAWAVGCPGVGDGLLALGRCIAGGFPVLRRYVADVLLIDSALPLLDASF